MLEGIKSRIKSSDLPEGIKSSNQQEGIKSKTRPDSQKVKTHGSKNKIDKYLALNVTNTKKEITPPIRDNTVKCEKVDSTHDRNKTENKKLGSTVGTKLKRKEKEEKVDKITKILSDKMTRWLTGDKNMTVARNIQNDSFKVDKTVENVKTSVFDKNTELTDPDGSESVRTECLCVNETQNEILNF